MTIQLLNYTPGTLTSSRKKPPSTLSIPIPQFTLPCLENCLPRNQERDFPLQFLIARDAPSEGVLNRLVFSREEDTSCQEVISTRRKFQMGCDFPIEGGPQHFLQTGLLEFLSIFLVLTPGEGSGRGNRGQGATESSPRMLPLVLCLAEEKAGKGEEHYLPEFRGPDSKDNSN